MVATVQKCHYEALKTFKMLWFPAKLPMNPTRVFTASSTPELHWQVENIGVCCRSKKKQMHFTYIYELCNLIWLHFKIELVVFTYSETI